jgi:hypothetical protein
MQNANIKKTNKKSEARNTNNYHKITKKVKLSIGNTKVKSCQKHKLKVQKK